MYGEFSQTLAQEREKAEERMKAEKERAFELELEVKRLEAEVRRVEEQARAKMERELEPRERKVRELQAALRQAEQHLGMLKNISYFANEKGIRDGDKLTEGCERLQVYGRRLDSMRRSVGIL